MNINFHKGNLRIKSFHYNNELILKKKLQTYKHFHIYMNFVLSQDYQEIITQAGQKKKKTTQANQVIKKKKSCRYEWLPLKL